MEYFLSTWCCECNRHSLTTSLSGQWI